MADILKTLRSNKSVPHIKPVEGTKKFERHCYLESEPYDSNLLEIVEDFQYWFAHTVVFL